MEESTCRSVMDSTSRSSPPTTAVGSLATSPHPQVLSKNHLLRLNSAVVERGSLCVVRHLYRSSPLGNSEGFRSCAPEMGMKTNYVFLIRNQNITG